MLIHKADLNTDANRGPMGPCVQGFPRGLKHLEAGAYSGQMWPGSHAGSLSPDPLCPPDRLWGISPFAEASGRPEDFHLVFGILPANRELPKVGLKGCVWT